MRFTATETVSISVAALAFLGSVTSAFYTYSNRNRELDIKLVELGIGILRSDPKDTGLTAARGWALQVIEENSRVNFSDEDRAALLHKPLLFNPASEQSRQLQQMLGQLQSSLENAAKNNTSTPSQMLPLMMMMMQNQANEKSRSSTTPSPAR
jgi:uncharacterized protein (DUF1778 family)